jgi:hypothetical protein
MTSQNLFLQYSNHELAYENKAYFDSQRTRKVYNLQAGNFADAFTYRNGTGAIFNEQYMR